MLQGYNTNTIPLRNMTVHEERKVKVVKYRKRDNL